MMGLVYCPYLVFLHLFLLGSRRILDKTLSSYALAFKNIAHPELAASQESVSAEMTQQKAVRPTSLWNMAQIRGGF